MRMETKRKRLSGMDVELPELSEAGMRLLRVRTARSLCANRCRMAGVAWFALCHGPQSGGCSHRIVRSTFGHAFCSRSPFARAPLRPRCSGREDVAGARMRDTMRARRLTKPGRGRERVEVACSPPGDRAGTRGQVGQDCERMRETESGSPLLFIPRQKTLTLDFQGRCSLASAKNFQLEAQTSEGAKPMPPRLASVFSVFGRLRARMRAGWCCSSARLLVALFPC